MKKKLISTSVAQPESEPEPVEPKLFETQSWRQNKLFNKYLLSVWRIKDEEKPISTSIGTMVPTTLKLQNSFTRQYLTGAGAEAKIWDKGGTGVENK